MEYKMEIAGLERSLQLFPVSDDLSIAAFILFGDVEITEAVAGELLKKAPEFDILFTAEAKSIPLIHEMARQSGASKYFVARKAPKTYMTDPISVDDKSITTHGMQKLYLGREDADLIKGKRILIIDDVVSTGGSLKAMEKLVELCGGKVTGRVTCFAEGDAGEKFHIKYLGKLPLFNADGSIKG